MCLFWNLRVCMGVFEDGLGVGRKERGGRRRKEGRKGTVSFKEGEWRVAARSSICLSNRANILLQE
jgi:hypothetical protein